MLNAVRGIGGTAGASDVKRISPEENELSGAKEVGV